MSTNSAQIPLYLSFSEGSSTQNGYWQPLTLVLSPDKPPKDKVAHFYFLRHYETQQVINIDSPTWIRVKCLFVTIATLPYMAYRSLYFVVMAVRDLAIALFQTIKHVVCCAEDCSPLRDRWVVIAYDLAESLRSLPYGICMTALAAYGIFTLNQDRWRALNDSARSALNMTLHRKYLPKDAWKQYRPFNLAPCLGYLGNYKETERVTLIEKLRKYLLHSGYEISKEEHTLQDCMGFISERQREKFFPPQPKK